MTNLRVSQLRAAPAVRGFPIRMDRRAVSGSCPFGARGPAWDHSKPRRQQDGWDAHAGFVDALTEEGVVVLGGPIGEGDGENALLIVDASDEAEIRARLAEDPWADDLLTVESVRPWSVWARSDARP